MRSKFQANTIAIPDQKSLIDYLMPVLDGERVTARVKQFMTMIEVLTTDYILECFIQNKSAPYTGPEKQKSSNLKSAD